jgi:hypothetical protein
MERPKLGESDLHVFLKKIGVSFLLNQGCFLVDTEVPLSRFGQRRIHELDEHHVIDVCGLGELFVKPNGILDETVNLKRYKVRQNILRGIEVKVSREDFKNGFFCTGCNYNYLLTPMRLIGSGSLPPGVGLIEYNKYKFSAGIHDNRFFSLRGLRVVKKASFRKISHYQVDNATSFMIRRQIKSHPENMLKELIHGQKQNGYRFSSEY